MVMGCFLSIFEKRRSGATFTSPGYINKILIYLNKEMDAVWNLNTIVDRKRWGVGCLAGEKNTRTGRLWKLIL